MKCGNNRFSGKLAIGAIIAGFCSTSAMAEPGVSSSEIVIGQSAAFTGTPAEEVKQATSGAKLYFDQVNKKGGVSGRKIRLESLDDGFDPKRTVENTAKLLKEKNAFALFLYRGTPTTEAVLPMLKDAKVPLIAPVTGATSLHEPMSRYVFNVRSKYRSEVAAMIRQLSSMGLQKLGVVASEDSFGTDALTGVKAAVKEHHLPEPTIALYKRNTVDVDDAVKKISASNPQAVLMICTAKPCEAFLRQYRQQGGHQPMFTLSNVSSKAFIQSLGENARGLGMTQVFPNPSYATIPLIKEYHELVKGHPELVDSYPALEGFVSAKILVEGLRKSGASPTREGLITAMESFNNMDFGGMAVTYSPTSRNGSNFVELTVVGRNGVVVR